MGTMAKITEIHICFECLKTGTVREFTTEEGVRIHLEEGHGITKVNSFPIGIGHIEQLRAG